MHFMHRSTIALLASCGLSLMAASVQAQPQPHQPTFGGGQPSAQRPGPAQAMPAPQGRPNAAPAPQAQRPGTQGPAPHLQSAQRPAPQHSMARGAGPDHRWERGTKVPAQYRSKHYVVNDWRRHGLHQPGRGQQWVQYGSDYLLVSIATGVIAQLVLAH